jgi:hypothetical protein
MVDGIAATLSESSAEVVVTHHVRKRKSRPSRGRSLRLSLLVDAEVRRSIGAWLCAVTELVGQGLGTSAIADRL